MPYGEKGYDGYRKVKKVPFPGKKARVRMELKPDFTFELEARRWGKEFDGLRPATSTPEGREEPEMFAPLEYLDKEAAALHITGTWDEVHTQIILKVDAVNEIRNGELDPPVTLSDVHYACGKALGRPIKGSLSDAKDLVRLVLNEYLEYNVVMAHEYADTSAIDLS